MNANSNTIVVREKIKCHPIGMALVSVICFMSDSQPGFTGCRLKH
jgi:hypothetical protein